MPSEPEAPAPANLGGETQEMTRLRDTFIGPYRVEFKVGDGGMGIVYKAHDAKLKRFVAVKVLRDKLASSDRYLKRLNREARTIASLSHPAVIQIFAFEDGKENPTTPPYLVMEYVEGESVESRMRTQKRFDLEPAVRLVRLAAQGLEAAFERGIIHRDIKPSNLLITAAGALKIVDFGLAKEIEGSGSITDDGMILGTPHYISPEQGSGGKVDHRSDIYSLGATFYHMLTGRPAFEGDSHAAVIFAHIHSAPVPPHKVRSDVPASASYVIGKMLAKDSSGRYASYRELIQDLDKLERGEAIGRDTLAAARATFLHGRTSLAARLARWLLPAAAALAAFSFALWKTSARAPSGLDPAIELAGMYQVLPDGHEAVTLDFRDWASQKNSEERLARSFIFDPWMRRHALPSVQAKGLMWTESPTHMVFRYPVDELERLELIGLQLATFSDFAIELVHPAGEHLRAFTFRMQDDLPTAQPVLARRSGENIPIEPLPPPVPDLPAGPYDLTIRLRVADGHTEISLDIRGNQPGAPPLYPPDGAAGTFRLPGTDWRNGVLVIRSLSPVTPGGTGSLQALRLEGRLNRGKRVEEVPPGARA